MKKLKIAYIGNGKSTNRYHIPFVLTRPDKFEIKKIYQRNLDKFSWDKIEGVEYTANLDDLLNDPSLDLIVVTTPAKFHYEFAKKVLESGHNCLLEKPFVIEPSQARDLFELAKKKELFLSAYQNRRFDSDIMTVKKVMDSGLLGQIYELEMHFDYFRPEVPQANKENFTIEDSFLYGHACHTIDQVLYMFGKPDRVTYDVKQILGKGAMNDYFDIDMHYKNMKVSVKSSYFRIEERPSFVVYGTNGKFIKANKDKQEEHLKLFYMPGHPGFGQDQFQDYGILTYLDGDEIIRKTVKSETGDYGLFYDSIYESLANGQAQLVKEEDTLNLMDILFEGINSI